MREYYTAPLGPLHAADGASYNTSVVLTDVSPGGLVAAILCPGGALDVGTQVNINAFGTYATSATTPNLTLGVYFGGVAGIALAATTPFAVANTATINWPWVLQYQGVVQAVGTAGAIQGRGSVEWGTSLSALTRRSIPETAQATVAIDTTVQKAITIGALWGTSAAANIVICRFLSVELLS